MSTPGRIIQITGLPRSGTAFMATVMMLHPDCNVFHECIADGPGWRERIAASRQKYPITADCGTYQYMPGAVIEYSDKLYLDRDAVESGIAVSKAMGTQVDMATSLFLFDNAHRWVEKYRVPVESFDGLFTVDSLRRIWRYFGLGYFPESKVAQLIRMRIARKDMELFSLEKVAVSAHELL